MAPSSVQRASSRAWALARAQHDVVSRRQLLALGYSAEAVRHRIRRGRLHPLWPGVYAVGRPNLTRYGMWMGAVLACGDGAAVSHEDAGALWGIRRGRSSKIHLSVPADSRPRRRGIVAHRRTHFESTRRHNIPVTTPICTLIDLATRLDRDDQEAAINEADKRRLVDPERLREALDHLPRRPGIGTLRATLDYRTFTLTDSRLERLFLPIVRRVGLPMPLTQQYVNGFRVDFYWPELGLVVETDGLTYHRTPAQQAEDAVRNQVHTAAGLTALRFTRAQVKYEAAYVERILGEVAHRLLSRQLL